MDAEGSAYDMEKGGTTERETVLTWEVAVSYRSKSPLVTLKMIEHTWYDRDKIGSIVGSYNDSLLICSGIDVSYDYTIEIKCRI